MQKRYWFQRFLEADGAGGGDVGGADNGAAPDNSNAGTEGGEAKPNIFDLPKDNAPANTDNNPTVPEEYQFNLGEGLTISDDMRTRFTQVAKEAKLTQGQTDALMQMHSEMMLELINAGDKQAEEWAEECSKQGMLTPEKLGYANEALKVFGGDEVKNVLIQTGAANHPAVMRMLQTIGELIHEDTNKEGASKPPNNNDLSTILFPNSKY